MAQFLRSEECASDQRRMTLKIDQTLDTAWAEPPAQKANRKGRQ